MKNNVSIKTYILSIITSVSIGMLIVAVLFTFFIIPKRESKLGEQYSKLLEINALVEKYYVGEVDNQFLSDSLSYGMLLGLDDRYAGYITADDAEENLNSFMGYNTGMGIQVTLHPDTGNIYVTDVHKDSPAEKGGIKQFDQIVSLDDKLVTEVGYTKAIDYIKTVPSGNTIKTVVLRNGKETALNITLTQFVSQSVFYEKIEDKGYIHISAFNDKTVEQFKSAVDDMLAQNVTGLVFDLRGNGGGTLTSVYQMVDYLVPEGLIVKVDYKEDADDETYLSDKHEVDIPMAVLTDESTASASELFTQSLIDYGKAVSVGRKTYGKGVVQRTFTLSDGSMVRFTVAKYYTKSGICVDGIGVSPKIEVEWEEDELTHRFVNGIRADKDYLAACDYLNKNTANN